MNKPSHRITQALIVLLGCLCLRGWAAAQPVTFSIAQIANAGSVNPGDVLVYTINYSNVGTQIANGVVITETYDPNVTFLSGNPAPDSGTTNRWTVGNLSPGLIKQILFKVRVSSAAVIGSSLVSQADISDASTSATASATTAVAATQRQYVLTHTGGPRRLRVGVVTRMLYRLRLRSIGVNDTTNVTVTDSLPAGLSFVQSVPAPTTQNGNTLTYVFPTMTSQSTQVIMLEARLRPETAAGTVLANTAAVIDDQGNTAGKSFIGSVR